MSSAVQKTAFLVGRTILGGYFLYNAVNHFKSHRMMAQYAGSKHVPLPEVAVPATGALLAFGGTSLLLGLKPRHGALAIIGFLAGVSPVMHDFWRQQDPNQRMAETVNFTKNMALMGATLALAGVEKWPLSVAAGREDKPLMERVERTLRRVA